ncbi:MAG: hypothetical protein IKY61_08305, partial [Thermoguttaceae bacterium]|nr:hypothetical protein [Thermoguttaceae bacterium]
MSNKENIEINSQAYRSLILPAENINHENEFQQIFDFKTNGNIKNVHIYLLTNQSGKAIKGKMFPDEISQSTFNAYLEYLTTSIQNKTFAQYDPTCVENDVIPTLSTQSLSNWSKIKEACVKELTNNEQIEKEDYLELKGNLIVIEAEIETDAPDSNATEEKFYFL